MAQPFARALLLALALTGTACTAGASSAAPVAALEALVDGTSLDGRTGLDVYAPDARAAAVESAIRQARYWGRSPDESARLEALLARHASTDEGRRALYRDLLAFNDEVVTFTETHMHPGLADVLVDGDRAVAFRVGVNPGGEFREEVRFVRIGPTWYLDLP
jgi:hypothetical protein